MICIFKGVVIGSCAIPPVKCLRVLRFAKTADGLGLARFSASVDRKYIW